MIDICVPIEQEGTKAVVRSWLKQIGDMVHIDDPLVELETDKVTQEVAADAHGILAEIVLKSGDDAEPGMILARLTSVSGVTLPNADRQSASSRIEPITALSPSVRRALAKRQLDSSLITGTGKGGRITRADVDAFVAEETPLQVRPMAAALGPAPPSTQEGARSVPHDSMRLAIARNMLNSVTVAPHVTAVFEADLSAVIAHRNAHKTAFERDGVKLTLSAYFILACVAAMKAVPVINSRWYDDRIDIFSDINIGIGTALGDKGLVVPVVHRSQSMSLLGVASKLGDLTDRARAQKLTPADMRDGTFTVSNHGVSGSLLAAPIIINQPQSAILGIGKMEKRVVVRELGGQDVMVIRPMCYVSLTIDHRVVDGHQTNTWLSHFVGAIEGWHVEE